jgi:transposase
MLPRNQTVPKAYHCTRDTARAATSGKVKDLRREAAAALKEVVADLTLENRLLKKSMSGDGEDEA